MDISRIVSKLLFVTTVIYAQTTGAEPTGAVTTLLELRPYVGGNTIYVYPADTSPCNTSIYTIDLSTPTGKAAYATALAALVAGKRVQLEAIAPCTGLYSGLQSIYIFPN